MDNFIDELLARAQAKKSRVLFRLAPSVSMLKEDFRARYQTAGAMLFSHCVACIEGVKDLTAAVIFDRAAFDFYGLDGVMAMSMAAKYAHKQGLFVIVDGCFGGRGESVLRYAESYFYADGSEGDNRFFADAITVSPYCGAETLKKLASMCSEEGRAAFVTVTTSVSDNKEDFENVKTEGGEALYRVAADDAAAYGEMFVGENGYSVLGFVTEPVKDTSALRGINRWGIAIVNATVPDLDKAETYGLFYRGEGEGEFVAVSDADVCRFNGTYVGNADAAEIAGCVKECVLKVEEHRLGKE
ncbi:MAG: orotidine 5'-phosphate decarboxylase [Clostridia bacterium]|nr:orotidine 5'-phosphate decarboxylase [Clostridia bacterium]